jgi:hypothetical protein
VKVSVAVWTARTARTRAMRALENMATILAGR